MGALLAASLIIIPAAIGRRLTDNISHFLIASSVASVLSVGIGVLLNASVFPKFGLGADNRYRRRASLRSMSVQENGVARCKQCERRVCFHLQKGPMVPSAERICDTLHRES
jgi:ABC 3 transport family